MADAVRKIAVYLGLAEDDRYDDYDEAAYSDEAAAYDDHDTNGHRPGRRAAVADPDRPGGVARPRKRVAVDPARITTLHPKTYNEARAIGQSFRAGVPVLMDLSEMSDDDAKRLVDFAAGLIFGRHGDIDRVADKVFLLSPESVEVTTGNKRNAAPGA